MGAALGNEGIPEDMASKVLTFDCEAAPTKQRPAFLNVGKYFKSLVSDLIKKRY